jgi:hypothetical protein
MEYFTDQAYLKDFLTWPWALGGALYIFGACMYMLKVPERFKPGYFDIVVITSNFIIIFRVNHIKYSISLLFQLLSFIIVQAYKPSMIANSINALFRFLRLILKNLYLD